MTQRIVQTSTPLPCQLPNAVEKADPISRATIATSAGAANGEAEIGAPANEVGTGAATTPQSSPSAGIGNYRLSTDWIRIDPATGTAVHPFVGGAADESRQFSMPETTARHLVETNWTVLDTVADGETVPVASPHMSEPLEEVGHVLHQAEDDAEEIAESHRAKVSEAKMDVAHHGHIEVNPGQLPGMEALIPIEDPAVFLGPALVMATVLIGERMKRAEAQAVRPVQLAELSPIASIDSEVAHAAPPGEADASSRIGTDAPNLAPLGQAEPLQNEQIDVTADLSATMDTNTAAFAQGLESDAPLATVDSIKLLGSESKTSCAVEAHPVEPPSIEVYEASIDITGLA